MSHNEIITGARSVTIHHSPVYVVAAAQDRLIHTLNLVEPNLMQAVSAWINHLYFCEIHYMQHGPGQVLEADPWIAHVYRHPQSHLTVHVPAPAMGLQVSVRFRHIRHTCESLRTEISSRQRSRSALLPARLQLSKNSAEVAIHALLRLGH